MNTKCPLCNGIILYDEVFLRSEMDGNDTFHCSKNTEHKFWRNMREFDDVLHLNKNASESTFHSEQDFKLINNQWVNINK
jgi:hypothetical protein